MKRKKPLLSNSLCSGSFFHRELHLIEKSERNLEEKIDALVKEAIDTVEVIRC